MIQLEGGKGIIVVASAFKRFILKLDMVTSNFLHIFVQDCSLYVLLQCNNTYPWTIPFANPRCSAIDSFDEMWRYKKNIEHNNNKHERNS